MVTYKTLMVHLDVGQPNTEVLRVTAALGQRMGSAITGIAVCQPTQFLDSQGYVSGEAVVACRDELEAELRDAERAFRAAFVDTAAPLGWRSQVTAAPLADHLAREARSADLVVTSVLPADILDMSRHIDIGDLVMKVGRPVLVVPSSGARLSFERVVIAWKDTREARRAVVDALPLLAMAKHVTIAEIAGAADQRDALSRVQDVVTWLARHGVTATPLVTAWGADETGRLGALLTEQRADLVVAGAYGHSRLREWAFGGITRELLRGSTCALLSH